MENHILYVPINYADFLLAKATLVNQHTINRVGSLEKAGHCRIFYDVIIASKGKCSVYKSLLNSYNMLLIRIMACMKCYQFSQEIYIGLSILL